MINNNVNKDEIPKKDLNFTFHHKNDKIEINWKVLNDSNKITENITVNNCKFIFILEKKINKINFKLIYEFPDLIINYFKMNNINKQIEGMFFIKNTLNNKSYFKNIFIDPKINNNIDFDVKQEYTNNVNLNIIIILNLEKLNNKNISNIYCGLTNFGATCYLNSYLQFLYFLKIFVNDIIELSNNKDNKLIREMISLFYFLNKSEYKISPYEFIMSMGINKNEMFIQQDVQEFGYKLLEQIEKICIDQKKYNFIKELFEGEQESYIDCSNINYESKKSDKFYDIQLKILNLDNIYDSFKNYLIVEKLDGKNKYNTVEFGEQEANKGIRFNRFPNVLSLHLKRFEFDFKLKMNVKIFSKFEFYEEINLNQYVSNNTNKNDNEFVLFSVFLHIGDSSDSGHYINFIRPRLEEWYKFDDETVTNVSWDQVKLSSFGENTNKNLGIKHSSAYILVYLKKSKIKDLLANYKFNLLSNNLTIDFNKKLEISNENHFKKIFCKIYLTNLKDVINTKGTGILKKCNSKCDSDIEINFKSNFKNFIEIVLKKEFTALHILIYLKEYFKINMNQLFLLDEKKNVLILIQNMNKEFLQYNYNEDYFNLYFLYINKIEFSLSDSFIKETIIIFIKEINENNELYIKDYIFLKSPYIKNLNEKPFYKNKNTNIYYEYNNSFRIFREKLLENITIKSLTLILVNKDEEFNKWVDDKYNIINFELHYNNHIDYQVFKFKDTLVNLFDYIADKYSLNNKNIILKFEKKQEVLYYTLNEVNNLLIEKIQNFKIIRIIEINNNSYNYEKNKDYFYRIIFLNSIILKKLEINTLVPNRIKNSDILDNINLNNKDKSTLEIIQNFKNYDIQLLKELNVKDLSVTYDVILDKNIKFSIKEITQFNITAILNLGDCKEDFLEYFFNFKNLNEYIVFRINKNKDFTVFDVLVFIKKVIKNIVFLNSSLKKVLEKEKLKVFSNTNGMCINFTNDNYFNIQISTIELKVIFIE